jgi:membrane associated rhomboid family serine protease
MHLVSNAISQLFFGLPLELSHGSTRIALIYLSGIFLGGLGREVTAEESLIVRPLAGASGRYSATIQYKVIVAKIWSLKI